MTNAQKAAAWRERMGLSKAALADLTGYSEAAIRNFENGRNDDYVVGKYAWRRYTLACAAVEREIKTKKQFAW